MRIPQWARITVMLAMLAALIALMTSGVISAPTQPILYLPENDTSTWDNTPYFEWTEGSDAENHRLLVDNDEDWSSPEIDMTLTTENYYFVPMADSLTEDNYHWKVVAQASGTENSSETRVMEITGKWLIPVDIAYFCGESEGYEASKSIDENTSTAWRHNSAEYHQIIFDLENLRYFEKIRIYQAAVSTYRWGQSKGITVYVSSDNSTWGDNVWEGALDSTGWSENESCVFNKMGRYIKIVSKSNFNQQDLFEFQAWAVAGQEVELANDEAYDVSLDALLNAQLNYNGQDGTRIRFDYQSDYQCYFGEENENWNLSDHAYTIPITDPATDGDWGNRSPMMYLAASDSSAEDKAFVAAQGENGWQCDGVKDQDNIQQALENAGNGGAIYLFDGLYKIDYSVDLLSQRSIIGESRENTIIWNTQTHIPPPYFGDKENILSSDTILENFLLENITLRGGGRLSGGEHLGFNSIHGARNVVLKNVKVMDISCIAIYFEVGGSDSYNNWVIDSEVTNTGHGGIIFSQHSGTNHNKYNYILNNVVKNTALSGADYTVFGMPYYTGDGGIVLYSPKHCVIANNTIENTGVRGIGVVYGGGDTVHAAENVLIQGNYVHRSNITENYADNSRVMNDGETYDNLLLQDIYLLAAIELGGGSGHPSFDVTLKGNDVNQFPYAVNVNNYCENFVIDNNSFYNSSIDYLNLGGSGHTLINNVNPIENYTVEKFTSSENHVENTGELLAASYYIWRPTIDYGIAEDNLPWRLFQTSGLEQPILYSPENDENVFAGYIHFEWTEGTGSQYSRLVVSHVENFAPYPPYWDNYIDLNMIENYLSTEYLSGGRWYWKVAAVSGYSENWTDVHTFYLYDEQLIETWTGTVMTEEENAPPPPPPGNVYPNLPTDLLTRGHTNPTELTYATPWFSAIGTDNDGDQMIKYALQVDNDSNYSSPIWSSGEQSITPFDNGDRCSNINYSGGTLSRGINYFWRIRFWDNYDNAGPYSTETAMFRFNQLPTVPTNLTDLGTNVTDFTPTVSWVKGTDADNDTVTTYVYVGTNSTPTTVETTTLDNTCDLGNTVTLQPGITYYYRLRSWDGLEWSAYSYTDQFKMTGGEEPPSPPPSSITIVENEGGAVYMVHPIEDAPVMETYPDYNFSSSSFAYVRAAYTAGSFTERSYTYLKYNIPENILSSDYELRDMRLTATVWSYYNTPEILLYETSSDWNETTITWNNKPYLGNFVVKFNVSWGENFENYSKVYASLDNYSFTSGMTSFVIVASENTTYYGDPINYREITLLTREAGNFGTVEFVYMRIYPIEPTLVSLCLLGMLMFCGFGLYVKLKDIHNIDTLLDGFETLLLICLVVVVGVALAKSFL